MTSIKLFQLPRLFGDNVVSLTDRLDPRPAHEPQMTRRVPAVVVDLFERVTYRMTAYIPYGDGGVCRIQRLYPTVPPPACPPASVRPVGDVGVVRAGGNATDVATPRVKRRLTCHFPTLCDGMRAGPTSPPTVRHMPIV